MKIKINNISLQEVFCLGFLFISIGYVIYVHVNGILLPFDDAFITYKYVNNLLAGKGLVYNEGHRIFGSSSPLYLLFLSAMKLLFPSFDVSVLSVSLILLCLWALSTSRFCLGAFLGGSLAVLARPEGILSATICVLIWCLYSRKNIVKF